MPQIRRDNLPPALYDHLLDRVQQRSVSAQQLRLLLTPLGNASQRVARKDGTAAAFGIQLKSGGELLGLVGLVATTW